MATALVTCLHLQRHFAKFQDQYEAHGVTPVLPPVPGQQLDAAGMLAVIAGADAVIAGDDEIDAAVLEAGKAGGLKAVIKWGIGTDSIDKRRAAELGLPVYNTPGVFSEEVADLALSHLLMLSRGTHLMSASIEAGGWRKVEGRSLGGLTAGVVGLGGIGLAIVRRVGACGMRVIGSDVRALDETVRAAHGVEQVPFERLIGEADVILLACALTAESRHMLNAATFAAMKRGVWVINVARGGLVDEAALIAALQSGHVAAAGLDVFEVEPLPATSPLLAIGRDRLTLSSHNGSNTREAVHRINQMTTDILFHVLGKKPASGFTPNRVA